MSAGVAVAARNLAHAGEVAALKRELSIARGEAKHWRSNHDQMVARKALLEQRPDLPVDRIPAMRELERLQAENDRLRAALEAEKAESATFRHGLRLANERYEAALADKLAAVKRMQEAAAGSVLDTNARVSDEWDAGYRRGCMNFRARIRALPADEIARGEG